MLNPITGNKKPHRANDGVSTCLTAVTAGHIKHKTHKDYAMNQDQKATQVSSRAEDTAFEIAELHNKCRTTQVIKDLEQSIAKTDELTDSMLERSANRADWAVLCGFALFIAISVMWFFSQSKPVASIASMCGGAL